jgi:hypothetical protein
MQALLTVNIFAQWILAALLGVGLFGLVLALPLLVNPDPRSRTDKADHSHHFPRDVEVPSFGSPTPRSE